MLTIKKNYITDEKNRQIAVQIDIDTFNKIEEIFEDYALYKLMEELDKNEILNFDEAKKYYQELVN
jgi:hypothetical protein